MTPSRWYSRRDLAGTLLSGTVLSGTALIGGLLTTAGCATGTAQTRGPGAPDTTGGPGSTPPPGAGPATSTTAPATTTTPTTLNPTELLPGANHNRAATPYVYDAKDVHDWLTLKDKAPSYPKDKKVCFLTFDDGPTNSSTPKVLDILKAKKVPATFFYIVGPQAMEKADPGIARRTVVEGHSIVIHSYSHNYGYLYPGGRGNAANVLADHDKAAAGIRKVLGDGYKARGFRYPGGHGSWKNLEPVDQALADRQTYWIEWNCANGDGETKAPKDGPGMLAATQSSLAQAGNPPVAVVLMHDYRDATATIASVPLIIDWFTARGYQFGVIN